MSSHPSLVEKGEDVFLKIRAHPNSSKKEIVFSDFDVDIYVNESPEKGKANKAIIKLLSKFLNISSSSIKIVKGSKSQTKTILMKGIKIDHILEKTT
ncbi:MAG: DUF167 domain-containing protein [Candidatus Heimdallarchaeota archaeon]|nr:DUF167 domain-containing protein [Candidatus Heimdallarchaeota archaeon]